MEYQWLFSGIPAYYYPTTTVFIDDSKVFLTNFSLQLHPDLAFKLLSTSQSALNYIGAAHNSSYVSERSVDISQEAGGNPITNHTITLNLSSIQEEIYNSKRFSEVAVVIVDYNMPVIDGLEFCRELANDPIKKILLTGKGDEKIAVAAFNEGIIDTFIQKNERDVIHLVDENILNLQTKYFQKITEEMRTIITRESPGFISDPLFCKFFHTICKQHDIVEYYLLELTGSFLMLDADANPSLLVVKRYEDLNVHYEFAKDNGAPKNILQTIRSGQKIPFTWQADDYFRSLKADDWEKQLFPATEMQGRETYYYSFIENPQHSPLDKERIYSYNQYLAELQSDKGKVSPT